MIRCHAYQKLTYKKISTGVYKLEYIDWNNTKPCQAIIKFQHEDKKTKGIHVISYNKFGSVEPIDYHGSYTYYISEKNMTMLYDRRKKLKKLI